MLTRLRVRNFKNLADIDVELGQTVVFIGPNNSGKTSALQALTLWDAGLRNWCAKRSGKSPEKRPGVTINRQDLISIPVANAKSLWHDLHVNDTTRREGKQETKPVFLDVTVDGVSNGREWSCGFEFYYANPESFYCRPLRRNGNGGVAGMPLPPEAEGVRMSFLQAMSGLAASEPKWEPGRINVLMGEGQTAQVLRNLCRMIYETDQDAWQRVVQHIIGLFGVELQTPEHVVARGEITMSYKERSGIEFDLSSSGRGLQQTLLLLAHLYAHPGSVLLLDEPDAHLEVLRQRENYNLLTTVARRQGSQVIAASHSEVVLNEAADKDVVVAFVGRPHRIDDRGSQVRKSLTDIGFDQYYLAEQEGWVLYLEGSTDLEILKTFAETLKHPAREVLERPFVRYVGNDTASVYSHFFGLKEACPAIRGIAIFDRLDKQLEERAPLVQTMWEKREIENYLCMEEVLMTYAAQEARDLFTVQSKKIMREEIDKLVRALASFEKSPWSPDLKATDEFLDHLFRNYFRRLKLPNLLSKSNYHVLAGLVPADKIAPEVSMKLDMVLRLAESAHGLDGLQQ